jgi:hypothetical protein
MAKDTNEVLQKLDSINRRQEHLDKQLSHILRLIEGDSMLNKIRPTGLISDIKHIEERLTVMQNKTEGLIDWWSERGKRKYIIDINLVTWGKVILWIITVAGAVAGFFAWINKHLSK